MAAQQGNGVAFTLLTAVPLHADTFYSGAAVNSDGSVYSWGVTSACSMSSHTTHMSSTLTSPKGRKASGSASDGCSSRVDLSLAADLTDLGTYSVVSYSWAFCPVLGRWFWNGCGSTASVSIGYSDNWYDYYHYDEAVCGVAPNEYLIHTRCDSSCNSNGFCARTFKDRVLEAYYYYADVGSVRICLY